MTWFYQLSYDFWVRGDSYKCLVVRNDAPVLDNFIPRPAFLDRNGPPLTLCVKLCSDRRRASLFTADGPINCWAESTLRDKQSLAIIAVDYTMLKTWKWIILLCPTNAAYRHLLILEQKSCTNTDVLSCCVCAVSASSYWWELTSLFIYRVSRLLT